MAPPNNSSSTQFKARRFWFMCVFVWNRLQKKSQQFNQPDRFQSWLPLLLAGWRRRPMKQFSSFASSLARKLPVSLALSHSLGEWGIRIGAGLCVSRCSSSVLALLARLARLALGPRRGLFTLAKFPNCFARLPRARSLRHRRRRTWRRDLFV